MTSTSQELDLTHVPAVDCAPWCRTGDGHTEVLVPDDQACFGNVARIAQAKQV